MLRILRVSTLSVWLPRINSDALLTKRNFKSRSLRRIGRPSLAMSSCWPKPKIPLTTRAPRLLRRSRLQVAPTPY